MTVKCKEKKRKSNYIVLISCQRFLNNFYKDYHIKFGQYFEINIVLFPQAPASAEDFCHSEDAIAVVKMLVLMNSILP